MVVTDGGNDGSVHFDGYVVPLSRGTDAFYQALQQACYKVADLENVWVFSRVLHVVTYERYW